MGLRVEEVAQFVRDRWGDVIAEVGADAVERYSWGNSVPRRLLAEAGRQGLYGLSLPAGAGGSGADAVTWGKVVEEIGYLSDDPALPVLLGIHVGIAKLVWDAGNDHLRQKYAIPMATGGCLPALAFSEGTDLFSMRTSITSHGSGFRISGRKEFVTGGTLADVFLVYASDDHGDLVACLVEAGDDGVEVRPASGTGFRTAGVASLTLANVHLQAERILAAADGLSNAQEYLNARRLSVACFAVGQMRAILERTTRKLAETERYGQVLTDLPNVQAALGRMFVAVETSRSIVGNALSRFQRGEHSPIFDPIISVAKYHVTEQALAVVEGAFRVLGGHAYYGDPRYGMYFRDFIGFLAGAGTQDLLEINLGTCVTRSTDLQEGK